MKKMSVTRLVTLSTEHIHGFYRNPGSEVKFQGLHHLVVEAGVDTDRNLCMATKVDYRGKELYVTFDEVIISEGVAYCIMRKTARPSNSGKHLDRCKLLVAALASAFELGNKKLSTVRRLTESGYKLQRLNLTELPRVYVLDYNGKGYDIVADEPMCLLWMEAKLNAAHKPLTAKDFDKSIPPTVYSWAMEL